MATKNNTGLLNAGEIGDFSDSKLPLYFERETLVTVDVTVAKQGRHFVALVLDNDGDVVVASRRTKADLAVRDVLKLVDPDGDWVHHEFKDWDVRAVRAAWSQLANEADLTIQDLIDDAEAAAYDDCLAKGMEHDVAQGLSFLLFLGRLDHAINVWETENNDAA